ncbi:MAG: hypothetical protein ACI8QD_002116 [Cyclobacteriaceae bacterium]|jgi:hypothetical protein
MDSKRVLQLVRLGFAIIIIAALSILRNAQDDQQVQPQEILTARNGL